MIGTMITKSEVLHSFVFINNILDNCIHMDSENFILKKIRHYQATVDDYATYWEKRIAESNAERSEEFDKIDKSNDDLNKDYKIIKIKEDE